jgi:hypothetical protein
VSVRLWFGVVARLGQHIPAQPQDKHRAVVAGGFNVRPYVDVERHRLGMIAAGSSGQRYSYFIATLHPPRPCRRNGIRDAVGGDVEFFAMGAALEDYENGKQKKDYSYC